MVNKSNLAQTSVHPPSDAEARGEGTHPLEICSANGIFLFDKYGKKFLDLTSGIGVNNLGHRHPAIISAIETQLAKYLHAAVYGEALLEVQQKLAELIARLLPDNLSSVFLVNSGTEAVEGALKLAKRFTGRSEIISMKNGYHGSTHGSLSVMGNEDFKYAFRPLLPDVKFIRFNNADDLSEITEKTACVITEVIQGEAGVIPAEIYFLKELRNKCTETGALLILDEVQTGLGRTGKMFAFQHYGIVPDILLLGKALGGGLPLGAFISSSDIMKSLTFNPPLGHITTFGGNPLSCAAAIAHLNVLASEKIIDRVGEKEQIFRKNLHHSLIAGVRGRGLMLAVQFKNSIIAEKVVKNCLKNGLVTDTFLFAADSLRIYPPLIISTEDIKMTCSIFNNLAI